MDNTTKNPDSTEENQVSGNLEINAELNAEKPVNNNLENKGQANAEVNAEGNATLSYQKTEENSAEKTNTQATSRSEGFTRRSYSSDATVKRTIYGTGATQKSETEKQTRPQSRGENPQAKQPLQTQAEKQTMQQEASAPRKQPANAEGPQYDQASAAQGNTGNEQGHMHAPVENNNYVQPENSTQSPYLAPSMSNVKTSKEKIKQKKPALKPKNEKAKNKKKNIIITVSFIAGLTCAAVLLAVGASMNSKLTTQNLLNPTVRPTIELKEPADLDGELSTTKIVQKVEPSVVSIDVYVEDELSVAGSGSGVIFSEDGYIVTNAHVVEDSYALRVILNDETGYTATLVGEDVKNDLAVIKIDAQGLTPAEFGNSDQVQMGEKVIAIGNAVGVFPGSPTQGIISGVNRQIPMSSVDGSSGYRTLLQTDAAINPGNSGGALVNSFGQVIGINVAKLSDTSIENIGFAIPSNTVTSTVESIFNQEASKETPSIGIAFVELNDTNGPSNNLPSSGLYIDAISQNSDLYESEAEVGDIVTAINGQEIKTVKEARAIFATLTEGDTVELTVLNLTTEETFTVQAKLYDSAEMSSGYIEDDY